MPFGEQSITKGSKEPLMKTIGLNFAYVDVSRDFRAPLFYFMIPCYTISETLEALKCTIYYKRQY